MTPVYEKNMLKHIIVYCIDITEIKNKEVVISKQYQALEHLPIGVALLNDDGNYTYINAFHANLFGYEVEEMIGKPWAILYDKEEVGEIFTIYFPQLLTNGTW
jgi:PAS domain-containing protein